MAGERAARVWAWIAAAREGDAPASLAALCRAAVNWLAVDGASVTAVNGPAVREPLSATGELSARDHRLALGELERQPISPHELLDRERRSRRHAVVVVLDDHEHRAAIMHPAHEIALHLDHALHVVRRIERARWIGRR